MHWGEYIGELADRQPKRVLILCESHHTNEKSDIEPGKRASYSTASVVETDYIKQNGEKTDYRNYQLFSKIEQSFGVITRSKEERLDFWSKVYFGNYVPVLCGVNDNAAAKTIHKGNNRTLFNDQLFEFINSFHIEVVFCFSRLVYNNLPSLAKNRADIEKNELICTHKNTTDYINSCQYAPGVSRGYTTIMLNNPVTIYGMRHPSTQGGFWPEHYVDFLSEKLRECQS